MTGAPTKGEEMDRKVVKSARRPLEILELFEALRRPLGLKEIMARLDYPASSGSAILKSMVVLGYLEYDRDSRTYMPTMRIAQLGGWIEREMSEVASVSPLLSTLAEETGEVAAVATQSDLYMQYLHVVRPAGAPAPSISPGVVRPLAGSGLGLLLLSARADATVESLVRRINFESPDRAHRIDLAALMPRLHEIRARGYIASMHTVTQGFGVIGALLPGRHHGRRLAVGISGPVPRLIARHDAILSALRSELRRHAGKLAAAASAPANAGPVSAAG